MLFQLYSQGSPHKAPADVSEGVSSIVMFHLAGNNVRYRTWLRRECVACAEGKKECDFQRPCGACKAENRECLTTPSAQAQRQTRQDSHCRRGSASGMTVTPPPTNDPSTGGIAANVSAASSTSTLSSASASYLEIHPYSLVSHTTVASWPPYVYATTPEDSIGDEAEKYQAPTEWTSPTDAQYLRYSA